MNPFRSTLLSGAAALLLAGLAPSSCRCNFDSAAAPDADPNAPDADPNEVDADPNEPDAVPCTEWGYDPIHFDECMTQRPTGPLELTAAGTLTYDTDEGAFLGLGTSNPATEILTALDPDVRVILVDRLEISANTTLRVVGTMPLLVASWDDINILGTLDVSSAFEDPGAGAGPESCGASTGGAGETPAPMAPTAGAGGGGGGLGGDGGDGATVPAGSAGGANGVKVGTLNIIRGGCSGGSGGGGIVTFVGGGVGGLGGGAVYLAAQNDISVSGVLHAGGAGGAGGDGTAGARAGGGGGGSGGYLGLEAPIVTLTTSALLAANGGGGGGGTDITVAGSGADGPPSNTPAAAGGLADGNGGNGGNGGILGSSDGSIGVPGTSTRGAGGGGGGVGYIIVNSPGFDDQGATLSPSALLP